MCLKGCSGLLWTDSRFGHLAPYVQRTKLNVDEAEDPLSIGTMELLLYSYIYTKISDWPLQEFSLYFLVLWEAYLALVCNKDGL